MILLAVALLWAQETSSWTLQQVLDRTLEANSDARRAELGVTIAAIDARRARLDAYTTGLSVRAGTETGLVKPWEEEVQRLSEASWDTRLGVEVPIWTGGARAAAVDRADGLAELASVDQSLTVRSLQRAAYTAYWNVKGQELLLAATDEGIGVSERSLQIIRAKASAGLGTGIDVNRATVEIHGLRASRLAQENALYGAEQELIQLLNIRDTRLVLTDAPPDPGETPPPVSEEALASRAELQRWESELRIAESDVRAARAGRLPTLALTGTLGASGLTAGETLDAVDLRPSLDTSVGLQLTWTPFSLFRVRDAVEVARLRASQLEQSREGERTALAVELRQAAFRVDSLRRQVSAVDAQAELARENLGIVEGLYRQGNVGILDLFDASAAFRQARTEAASRRVELATAECDLRWMLGENPAKALGTP